MADERQDISLRSKTTRRQGFSAGHDARKGPPAPPRDKSQASSSSRQGGSRPSLESARSNESKPRPRPKANDSTTNAVKKRYSYRYAQPPDLSAVPTIPTLPPMPALYAQQNDSNASFAQRRGGLDIKALRDPDLQPERCEFLDVQVTRGLNYSRFGGCFGQCFGARAYAVSAGAEEYEESDFY